MPFDADFILILAAIIFAFVAFAGAFIWSDAQTRGLEKESANLMRLLPTVTIIALISNCAMAASPSAQRGLTIARTYCARCHSIDKVSESPLKIAPPFRTLHQRYPVTDLEEPLGEGIVTGHPTMPEFRFEPDQIHDFIEFLKTLE